MRKKIKFCFKRSILIQEHISTRREYVPNLTLAHGVEDTEKARLCLPEGEYGNWRMQNDLILNCVVSQDQQMKFDKQNQTFAINAE